MGEYVRYKGDHVKLGTCEDLYYTSFQKFKLALDGGHLYQAPNNSTPSEYAKPDSGFRFRFPFPDEDIFTLGDIGNNEGRRGITVLVNPSIDNFIADNFKARQGDLVEVDITQQKLVRREADDKVILAVVLRDPLTEKSYSIQDDDFVNKLANEIIRNHVSDKSGKEKTAYYSTIVERLKEGYHFETPVQKQHQETQKTRPPRPKAKRGKRM